jgi:hypothetical protein
MPEEKRFLPSGIFNSLIQNDESTGFPLIGEFADAIFSAKRDTFNRSLSKFQEGKDALQRKLTDARKVIFNRTEMVNWLYKMKQEAKSESDLVFIRARAQYSNEDKTDYERVGLMAGMYKEADRLLNIIIATEPTDQGKPHYTIIDQLEDLDKSIVDKDEIPGYYRIQKNERIKKHEFEVDNLDDDWDKHLAFAETGRVTPEFGNRTYLLEKYHTQFTLQLLKTEPLSRIRNLLEYQFKGFKLGEPADFLNHVQFRIIPRIRNFGGSDYMIYKQLVLEWIKEKWGAVNSGDELFLIQSLISALAAFLEDIFENRKRNDENKYNMVIKQALNHRLSAKNWHVSDQSMGGLTDSASKKSRAGVSFRDLVVNNVDNRPIMAIECFRLKSIATTEITSHVTKIFRNEPVGVSPLAILIYCETKQFAESWKSYLDFIENLEFGRYHLFELKKDVSDFGQLANISVAKALHNRELQTITVYHIMINLYP